MTACSDAPPGWEQDILHDVIEECNKHGGVVHIYVDQNSTEVHIRPFVCLSVCSLVYLLSFLLSVCLPDDLMLTLCLQGNVYVKCPSIPAAMAAVNALHGRFFAGECFWPDHLSGVANQRAVLIPYDLCVSQAR